MSQKLVHQQGVKISPQVALDKMRLMEGFSEILLPGELESRKRKEKEAEGVFLDDETWRQISEKGAEVGVEL